RSEVAFQQRTVLTAQRRDPRLPGRTTAAVAGGRRTSGPGTRTATHVRTVDPARGRVHVGATTPAGGAGGVRGALERGTVSGGRAGGARREFAVPARQGVVARDPDPAVPPGHGHPPRGTEEPG